MAYPDRVTVCVSTQAGCAMACTFCATGQAGFQSAPERRRDRRAGHRGHPGGPAPAAVRVVFMGMGEPLANYDRTWAAVERLHDDLGLSARHLTLSTVGVVPGIRRLTAEALPVNLAVSLHAANDELRDELGARSTGATRWPSWPRPAALRRRPPGAGCRSNGR